MKLFAVQQGTRGYVVGTIDSIRKNRSPFVTTRDLVFSREEVLYDHVIDANNDSYAFCKDMEQKGYSNLVINDVIDYVRDLGYIVFVQDGVLLFISGDDVKILG